MGTSAPTFNDRLHRLREAELRTLEPDNGWGTLETAQDFLSRLLVQCRQNPLARIYIR